MPPNARASTIQAHGATVFDTSTPASDPTTNALRLTLHWASSMLSILATVIALGAGPTRVADYSTNMQARTRRQSTPTTSQPPKASPPTARPRRLSAGCYQEGLSGRLVHDPK